MHLFNDEIMQALCWTLIHSLWQGLLLAIIGGTVILATKRSSSVVRYNSLSVLFSLFVLVACFTFARQLQFYSINNYANVHAFKNTEPFAAGNSNSTADVLAQKTNLEIFVNYFNEHASLVVTIWFIILSAQFIKLIANAGYVQRIKHYKTHAPTQYWKRRMQELAEQLQIKQRVLLLQSEIVKVPVMVGFLKPLILFPFSIMMQLSEEQVEAVLLHELAHIKRKDYFVNLLQNFAEIIFFFNPGVLWISSLIRDERENCCDDIAINQSKSKKEFIQALVSFQEYNLEKSKYTLAFPGRKNHLLNRIKRIITNNNKTLNSMEKISLATGIIIIGFVTIAFTKTAQKQEIKNVPPTIAAQKVTVVKDTIPDKETSTSKFTYVTTIDGKEYRAHIVNDKLTKLYIDGKKVPEEKLRDYKEITERIIIQAKTDRDKLMEENVQLAEEREKLLSEMDRMKDDANKMSADSINKLIKERTESYTLMAMKRQQEAMAMQEEDSKIANKVFHEQLTQHNAELKALVEELRKQQIVMQQEAITLNEKDSKKQFELLNKQIIVLKNEQMKIEQQRKSINEMILDEDRNSLSVLSSPTLRSDDATLPVEPNQSITLDTVDPPSPPIEENKTLNLVINQLMDEKIITSKNDLSIILNDEILKVNDVILPENIHAEFKEKYITGPQDHVIYSKHGGSTHVDINIDSGSHRAYLNENK
jgi:beta-lactamase regulating signal transducer with metallopeptidase domain